MARKKRVYLKGVYIPQKRGLLGPRHRLKLAEVERPFDYHALPARWLHEHHAGIETVEQAMPKGGRRIMARCPQCRALRRELYVTPFLRCRVCAGKFYLSRDGYRPRSRLTTEQQEAFERRFAHAIELITIKQSMDLARGLISLFRYFAKRAAEDARRARTAAKGKVRRTPAEAKRLRVLRHGIKHWTSVQAACSEALLEAQRLHRAA